ncbi:hypothetical protein CsSME_00004297 [Camellia sinensis var. sinensis]
MNEFLLERMCSLNFYAAMEHFINLVFTSVVSISWIELKISPFCFLVRVYIVIMKQVDAQVQQLDQYLKKFDEELQCERESAATTGSAAQNLKNNVKATSGRGRYC